VPDDALSQVFSALADPTRRAILARLASGEAPVKELARPFDLSAPAITKHLKVLERAGLIARRRQAQLRPCRIEERGLDAAAAWLEEHRAAWEERLDRLGEYLKTVAPPTAPTEPPRPRPTRPRKPTRRGRHVRRT
jgi:DNA-binding transcriptional ArsR family regulator